MEYRLAEKDLSLLERATSIQITAPGRMEVVSPDTTVKIRRKSGSGVVKIAGVIVKNLVSASVTQKAGKTKLVLEFDEEPNEYIHDKESGMMTPFLLNEQKP